MTFIVLALIVCVAALNILIALTMMVMEKTRDIAVMMSFGVTEAQVRRVFLLQGLLISVIGTVLGMIVGYGASWPGGHYRFPAGCCGLFDRLSAVCAEGVARVDCWGGESWGYDSGYDLSEWQCG